MKPEIMRIKEDEGYEAYFESIRNTVAGCRQKWKVLPKVNLRYDVGANLSIFTSGNKSGLC